MPLHNDRRPWPKGPAQRKGAPYYCCCEQFGWSPFVLHLIQVLVNKDRMLLVFLLCNCRQPPGSLVYGPGQMAIEAHLQGQTLYGHRSMCYQDMQNEIPTLSRLIVCIDSQLTNRLTSFSGCRFALSFE